MQSQYVDEQELKGVLNRNLKVSNDLLFNVAFRKWIKDVEEELSSVSKKEKLRLYLLLIGRGRHGEPCLNVNFDEGTVMLFKEVRHLHPLSILYILHCLSLQLTFLLIPFLPCRSAI